MGGYQRVLVAEVETHDRPSGSSGRAGKPRRRDHAELARPVEQEVIPIRMNRNLVGDLEHRLRA